MKKLLSTTLFILLTSCGSDSGGGAGSLTSFPNILELGQEVVPQMDTARRSLRFKNELQENSLFRTVTYNGTSGSFTTWNMQVAEVFGNNLSGVNTQVIVQLSQANGYLTDAASRYLAADGSFQNCEQTISSSDTDFGAPFFKDAAEGPFFEGFSGGLDAGYDDGKYSCFGTWQPDDASSANAIAFGREAITATDGCTDAYRYYIITGYSMEDDTVGHQVQKLFYDGCSKQIAIAMHIGTSVDVDPGASGGSSQGFNGRFELIGNVTTHAFSLRVGKMDVYANGESGTNLILASGVSEPVSGDTSNFVMRYKNMCNEDAACGSAADDTYCMAANSSQELSVDSTTTNCSSYETNFEALENFTYVDVVGSNGAGTSELESTGITMNAAAFGL